jgi:hypothetical protein
MLDGAAPGATKASVHDSASRKVTQRVLGTKQHAVVGRNLQSGVLVYVLPASAQRPQTSCNTDARPLTHLHPRSPWQQSLVHPRRCSLTHGSTHGTPRRWRSQARHCSRHRQAVAHVGTGDALKLQTRLPGETGNGGGPKAVQPRGGPGTIGAPCGVQEPGPNRTAVQGATRVHHLTTCLAHHLSTYTHTRTCQAGWGRRVSLGGRVCKAEPSGLRERR